MIDFHYKFNCNPGFTLIPNSDCSLLSFDFKSLGVPFEFRLHKYCVSNVIMDVFLFTPMTPFHFLDDFLHPYVVIPYHTPAFL